MLIGTPPPKTLKNKTQPPPFKRAHKTSKHAHGGSPKGFIFILRSSSTTPKLEGEIRQYDALLSGNTIYHCSTSSRPSRCSPWRSGCNQWSLFLGGGGLLWLVHIFIYPVLGSSFFGGGRGGAGQGRISEN